MDGLSARLSRNSLAYGETACSSRQEQVDGHLVVGPQPADLVRGALARCRYSAGSLKCLSTFLTCWPAFVSRATTP